MERKKRLIVFNKMDLANPNMILVRIGIFYCIAVENLASVGLVWSAFVACMLLEFFIVGDVTKYYADWKFECE